MMPITKEARTGLARARKALEKVRAAQIEAFGAYLHAIRMAARDGGSVREIAQEVGMSHQRVHQILQAGCDLCERGFKDVTHLVQAGKRLTICSECTERALATLRGEPSRGAPKLEPVSERSRVSCDSCGRAARKAGAMIRVAGSHVCQGCWETAARIIAAHPNPEPEPQLDP